MTGRHDTLSDQISELAVDLQRRGDTEGAKLCHAASGALLTLEDRAWCWERRYKNIVFCAEVLCGIILVTTVVLFSGW